MLPSLVYICVHHNVCVFTGTENSHSISKMAPTFITISFSHTPPPFTPSSPPPHLLHLLYLALLLFHKWPLLFSASLSHFSVPFFLCSLLLVAHHSKLSRVGNYYPQSQALNQRIFYTFYNASSLLLFHLRGHFIPSLTPPPTPPNPHPYFSPWHEDLLSLPLLIQQWLLTPFTKDDVQLTD